MIIIINPEIMIPNIDRIVGEKAMTAPVSYVLILILFTVFDKDLPVRLL